MNRKYFYWIGLIVACILALGTVYYRFLAPTKIAFVNYGAISLGNIYKANDNSFVKISDVSTDDLKELSGYDMIFLNGMGLRIVEEQREIIERIADKGTPIYTSSATNPANNLCNIDTTRVAKIKAYLQGGGKKNYRSLLNYVRKEIDGKLIYAPMPDEPIKRATEIIYHAERGKEEDDDELEFNSVAEYEAWLKKAGLWNEGGKKIVVTGQMANPNGMIRKLEEEGMRVYPISAWKKRMEFIQEIQPDAIVNLPHGRMGDEVVQYLREHNIQMFAPMTVNSLVEEWEKDPMGMSGGFLSQSVVMPEIDGGVRSFAVFAQYKDEEGWRHSFAVPERLDMFVETIKNYFKLEEKPNSEKKVAIYYFKGHGQGASMVAGGMEVAPSLYNFLKRLQQEGYKVDNLPANSKELEKLIMKQGAVLGTYSEGAIDSFMRTGEPELITKDQYEAWAEQRLRPERREEVKEKYGEFPGEYMATDDGRLAIARIRLGNVMLLPQNAAGGGTNAFKIAHGTEAAPPYPFIASYLYTRYGFQADALIHFGTHGSLEFTPKKQVALCSKDWPDRLVGDLPHFYVYSVGNVGEGVIAKRRSYATLTSYLTPPFLESSVRGIYRELNEALKIYNNTAGACSCDDHDHAAESHAAEDTRNAADIRRAALAVKRATVKLGIHRELELDSVLTEPYSEADILRIENFAEELASEKITGQLYTMGETYEPQRITSSVYAMATDPIAYSLLSLDKQRGRADEKTLKHRTLFTQNYLEPAKALVGRILANPALATDPLVCSIAQVTPEELAKARKVKESKNTPRSRMAMMMSAGNAKKDSVKPGQQMPPQAADTTAYSKEEEAFATALLEVENTIRNINRYKEELLASPRKELDANMNALNGGYIQPSPGGDPIANPNVLPTGRNLYSINAEATPSEAAWEKGIQLANSTIETYKRRHNGEFPRKISYTLWAGQFIETQGASLAQILYMLGVEPVRDAFGRVSDLRLISSKELGRPRIDVVVQTSGQLRDIAASRLFLINRAVEMAANAKDDDYENLVSEGVAEAQKTLLQKGLTPREAQEIATYRVFGGMNGGYGTSIQGMVESGDRWEKESEIAETYIHNMGAFYGNEKNWEQFKQYAFEAALTRTDVVIQPRQSNTWGALSLDHVYEFMGGLNLAVRHVTGKDPDAYFSDYRNRNNFRIQELKEAIGIESRTSILNPTYIKEKMKGEASSAGVFAETVRNTYGWNVMKPSVIDKELWDNIYNVYVKDQFNLGVEEYFKKQNPAALEEITAVMLETVRKGYWKASDEQVRDITRLHTDLVKAYDPSCSGFVCDNAKLKEFIASKSDPETAKAYKASIAKVREKILTESNSKSIRLEKEQQTADKKGAAASDEETGGEWDRALIAFAVLLGLILLTVIVKRKAKGKR